MSQINGTVTFIIFIIIFYYLLPIAILFGSRNFNEKVMNFYSSNFFVGMAMKWKV